MCGRATVKKTISDALKTIVTYESKAIVYTRNIEVKKAPVALIANNSPN
jgi:hypothetical protein